MDDKISELIEISKRMLNKAYCPYSNFPVGAAVLCDDGTVFSGCNVENASYGLSMCAERTAIFKAVSEGFRKFKAIAISSNLSNDFCSPCGACRQVIIEFGDDIDVYLTQDTVSKSFKISELLPKAFTPRHLQTHKKRKVLDQ